MHGRFKEDSLTHLVAGDEDGCPGEEPRDGLARGVLQEGAVELHRAVLLLLRSMGSVHQSIQFRSSIVIP